MKSDEVKAKKIQHVQTKVVGAQGGNLGLRAANKRLAFVNPVRAGYYTASKKQSASIAREATQPVGSFIKL